MLKELNIHSIALINSLRIEFTRGLNALTGETGAGKSIVVDCMNLALGHRGGREMVRTGEEKGWVRALFDIGDSAQAKAFLDEMQIEYDDDYAEISREIGINGRGLCRINGCVVPLGTLKAFTSILVDLHGQQEHQKLMDPAFHRMYLDGFGGHKVEKKRNEVSEACISYRQTLDELKQLNSDERLLAQKTDMLSMQVKEIADAKLREGEEEELKRKGVLYENSEKLSQSMRVAYERLYLGGKSLSAQESVKRAADAVAGIAELDPAYSDLYARLEELLYAVKDIGYEVQSIYEELSFDPQEAERVQDRLDLIRKLERKYGPELKDVIEYGKKAKDELDGLSRLDERRDAAERACFEKKKALEALGAELTQLRKDAAKDLCRAVSEQLRDLGMDRTRFEVRFTARNEVHQDGAEDVQFMISPNPGEPLRPLDQIASGGEISRFMLALKVILAENDGIETMIFDEIDTGISGRMAQVVGEKMALLGKEKQVICVTHLAQIAALADTQFAVEKRVEGERTLSTVRTLDDEGRLREIARLVGGAETDESGYEHARSMLSGAHARKTEIREAKQC